MLVLQAFLFLTAFACFVISAFTTRHNLLEAGLAAFALAWFLQAFNRL